MSLEINPHTPWRATTTLEPTVHHVRRMLKSLTPPATSVATQPSYDVIRAPRYVPPPREAVRAGADDFLRCASFGQRC